MRQSNCKNGTECGSIDRTRVSSIALGRAFVVQRSRPNPVAFGRGPFRAVPGYFGAAPGASWRTASGTVEKIPYAKGHSSESFGISRAKNCGASRNFLARADRQSVSGVTARGTGTKGASEQDVRTCIIHRVVSVNLPYQHSSGAQGTSGCNHRYSEVRQSPGTGCCETVLGVHLGVARGVGVDAEISILRLPKFPLI